jgi:hypothetical protein
MPGRWRFSGVTLAGVVRRVGIVACAGCAELAEVVQRSLPAAVASAGGQSWHRRDEGAQRDRGKGTNQPSESLGRDTWRALQTKAIRSCPGQNGQVREDGRSKAMIRVSSLGTPPRPCGQLSLAGRTYCDRAESLRRSPQLVSSVPDCSSVISWPWR